MSTLIEEYVPQFELGDTASFNAPDGGGRLTGTVARVYSSNLYHVEVDGDRYEVDAQYDKMRRATAASA